MFRQILKDRVVIKVSGKDSENFLQSLITNDIRKADNNKLIYAFLLSPQGKFLSDFFIFKNKDSYLLDLPNSQKSDVLKKFNLYKMRSEVQIEDVSNEFKVIVSSEEDEGLFADPRKSSLGYRGFKNGEAKELGSFENFENLRIRNLVPDADKDFIINKSFPHEFGGDELNAIDYNKGCYVGQELTARVHYRGVVRKKLVSFESDETLSKESEIVSDGRKIGIVLGMHNKLGLALVNIEDTKKVLHAREAFYVGTKEIIIKDAGL